MADWGLIFDLFCSLLIQLEFIAQKRSGLGKKSALNSAFSIQKNDNDYKAFDAADRHHRQMRLKRVDPAVIDAPELCFASQRIEGRAIRSGHPRLRFEPQNFVE